MINARLVNYWNRSTNGIFVGFLHFSSRLRALSKYVPPNFHSRRNFGWQIDRLFIRGHMARGRGRFSANALELNRPVRHWIFLCIMQKPWGSRSPATTLVLNLSYFDSQTQFARAMFERKCFIQCDVYSYVAIPNCSQRFGTGLTMTTIRLVSFSLSFSLLLIIAPRIRFSSKRKKK